MTICYVVRGKVAADGPSHLAHIKKGDVVFLGAEFSGWRWMPDLAHAHPFPGVLDGADAAKSCMLPPFYLPGAASIEIVSAEYTPAQPAKIVIAEWVRP